MTVLEPYPAAAAAVAVVCVCVCVYYGFFFFLNSLNEKSHCLRIEVQIGDIGWTDLKKKGATWGLRNVTATSLCPGTFVAESVDTWTVRVWVPG